MLMAVISDLHDNVAAWDRIAVFLKEHSLTTLINCGDTVAPAMLKHMANTFSGMIHTVFGNNADRDGENRVVKSLSTVVHYGDRGNLGLDGRRIGFNHFPQVAEQMADSGDFDLVCHGHTHLRRWEKHGETIILNPGTAGGMFQYPTFATVDLRAMTHQFHQVTL